MDHHDRNDDHDDYDDCDDHYHDSDNDDDIFSQSASILHIDPKAFAAGTQLEDFFDGLALRNSSYR